jgi:hypothetical protein
MHYLYHSRSTDRLGPGLGLGGRFQETPLKLIAVRNIVQRDKQFLQIHQLMITIEKNKN